MLLKNSYLHLFRRLGIKINKKACTYKYPWGWISEYDKVELINKNFNDEHINHKNSYFDVENFKFNSSKAYELIYQKYVNQEDFLNYNYTSFPLSITLNYLNNNSNIDLIDDELFVEDNEIIDISLKNSFIESNEIKFSDYKEHIWNNLCAGIIGPENTLYWDNIQTKQIVRVIYYSEDFFDIVDWERDITYPNKKWQVANINEIINLK